MAWFSANKNGGYLDHGLHPLIVDNHSVVGYSECHVTKSERVIEFRGTPVMTYHKGGPRKGRGVENDPFHAFWNTPSDWLEKGFDSSPKVGESINRDQSRPSSRDHYNGTNDNLNDSDNFEDDNVVCKDGVCFKANKGGAIKSIYPKDEDNEKSYPSSSYTIPSSTRPKKETCYESSYPQHDEKHKGNDYYAPSSYVPPSTQPKKETYFKSPYNNDDEENKGNGYYAPQPRKDAYYESSYPKNNEKNKGNGYYAPSSPPQPRKDTYYESSYPENNEKHKGNDYYAPSSHPQPRKDTYYESSYPENNEKDKGNGYFAPSSSVFKPRKDTYYESSYPENNEKHKGNGYYAPSSSSLPQPKKDSYYESSYPSNDKKLKENDHYAPQRRNETPNNRPIMTNSPPTKTRRDHTVRVYENTKSSLGPTVDQHKNYELSVSPARNNDGYEKIIDNTEARRRYANAPPRAEEKYIGTIDSKEAARKYNGVFVPL